MWCNCEAPCGDSQGLASSRTAPSEARHQHCGRQPQMAPMSEATMHDDIVELLASSAGSNATTTVPTGLVLLAVGLILWLGADPLIGLVIGVAGGIAGFVFVDPGLPVQPLVDRWPGRWCHRRLGLPALLPRHWQRACPRAIPVCGGSRLRVPRRSFPRAGACGADRSGWGECHAHWPRSPLADGAGLPTATHHSGSVRDRSRSVDRVGGGRVARPAALGADEGGPMTPSDRPMRVGAVPALVELRVVVRCLSP